MKMHIDIDITAEEMRRLMGLPDIEGLQRRMLEDIQQRLEQQGAEGYDPLEVMQPYLKSGLAGMDMMQRLFAMGMGAKGSKSDPE